MAVRLSDGFTKDYHYYIGAFLEDDGFEFINNNEYTASLTIDYPTTSAE